LTGDESPYRRDLISDNPAAAIRHSLARMPTDSRTGGVEDTLVVLDLKIARGAKQWRRD
jgi:hypothetical protein